MMSISSTTYLLYPGLLALIAGIWYQQVNSTVHDPYLDEYFHIRQAQVYCAGNFSQWDPKITTPPGLYFLSYLLYLAGQGCGIPTLRQTNASGIVFTWIPIYLLARQRQQGRSSVQEKQHAAHTALNIALFPPLFFFIALYYTDVVSTEVVLWALWFRQNETLRKMPLARGLTVIFVGVVALFFRQTNVFWVGVFTTALDAVDALRASRLSSSKTGDAQIAEKPATSLSDVVLQSWKGQAVYDVPVHEALFEDYLICAFSIVLNALNHIQVVLLAILPQLMILFLFAVFVVWNGGVVLGDKSNHVATIHTPQMLYVWAYILFFSFPVIVPGALVQLHQFFFGSAGEATTSARHSSSLQLSMNSSKSAYIISRILLFLVFVAMALVAVHYNTIVHPFTLADNRHYVFYVFRILRRHWIIKYGAAPVYVVCAWLAINALGQAADDAELVDPPAAPGRPRDASRSRSSAVTASTKTATVTTSFVLIWLATTTLTLVTAPLVEPRYYIMSWIVWRLHVLSTPGGARPYLKSMLSLWAETGWFLLINLVTGYMFLYKGFEWQQEPGAVQRFMW